jgi:hypothetical protein
MAVLGIRLVTRTPHNVTLHVQSLFVIDACNPILNQQLATKETPGVQNSEHNPNTLQWFQHANGQANTVFFSCV